MILIDFKPIYTKQLEYFYDFPLDEAVSYKLHQVTSFQDKFYKYMIYNRFQPNIY